MKIALGSDHAGFELKEYIRDTLKSRGIRVIDLGTHYPTPADYPVYAKKVAKTIRNSQADFGILICGTGLGMSISANHIDGIRAALCPDTQYAILAREHNNANVLCLGARFISQKLALEIVDVFISTDFLGNFPQGKRHKKRVALIDQLK
ncbi:ribose 5-phosphate isomerase B [bacterium]|nr:MAG: ribose 5-phosphate isomerase B [bacterium]